MDLMNTQEALMEAELEEAKLAEAILVDALSSSLEPENVTVGQEEESRYFVPVDETVADPIAVCFDPLDLDRQKIDVAVSNLKSRSRTQGYPLMAAQVGALATIYGPFVKFHANNDAALNGALGIYIGFVVVIGSLTFMELLHINAVENRKIEQALNDLKERVKDRVSVFAFKPSKVRDVNLLNLMSTDYMLAREERVRDKLRSLAKPIDKGLMGLGFKMFSVEFFVVMGISIGLAILGRFVPLS